MKTKGLKELFLDELADIYDAEQRIVRALPKLAKAASCPKLSAAFEAHRQETQEHLKRLERVFRSIGEKARGKKCEATVGLLEEGEEIAAEFKGSQALNAALIGAAQKVEHYEIASYGCLREWSEMMGYDEATRLLQETLDEEKSVDVKLTELARSGNNEEARDGMEEEDPGQNRLVRGAKLGTSSRSRTRKGVSDR